MDVPLLSVRYWLRVVAIYAGAAVVGALAALALALVCVPAKAQECVTVDAILKAHGDSLIERLPWPTATALLTEMSKIAEPPEAIVPSAALVFRLAGNGVRVEMFDAGGCGAFGASFSREFYMELRARLGTPA